MGFVVTLVSVWVRVEGSDGVRIRIKVRFGETGLGQCEGQGSR